MFRLLLALAMLTAGSGMVYAQTNEQKADSLQRIINLSIAERTTVDQIDQLTTILNNLNRDREGIEWVRLGREMAMDIGYIEGEQELLINLGNHYFQVGMPDSALQALDYAVTLGGDIDMRIKLLNGRARAHAMLQQYVIASELFEEMSALADSLQDPRYQTPARNNLGVVYANMGDQFNALRSYYEALELSEAQGDSVGMAIAYNNVGHQFEQMQNVEQAAFFLDQAEEISAAINLHSNLVRVYVNKGNLHQMTEDFDRAEYYHLKARAIFQETNNIPSLIQSDFNLGRLETRRGNFDNARTHLQRAESESERIGFPLGIYYTSLGFGNLEREMSNYGQAARRYKRALEVAEQIDAEEFILNSYNNLYETYNRLGNRGEALEWLERYTSLTEELRTTEKERLVTEFEVKFSLKEAQQESQLLLARQAEQDAELAAQRWIIFSSFIAFIVVLIAGLIILRINLKRREANTRLQAINHKLNTLNKTIRNQKKELEELNEIKTKLFAIVAHDLRGPLSSLQSLLYLLREHDLTKEEVHEITGNLETSLQENASMMDNLLAWARSQMSGITLSNRRFELEKCVQAVLDEFKFSCKSKQVQIKTDIKPGTELDADYDMIKLVFRNLVANAIKFSEPDSIITIRAKAGDTFVRVEIEDEGVGIPEEHRAKIFSNTNYTSRGTDNEKGSGLGLNLCKEFVEEHGGTIAFESEVGVGTTFIIHLPLPQSVSAEESNQAGKTITA
ncbi:MAG: ATP-binding protein [Balneolaceae bacterium]